MRFYSHLSDGERDQIAILRAAGRSMAAIARTLGRAKTTITRDIGGAAPNHGDVLRSRRLDEPRRETRRGGLAQSGQRLSRRSLRRRDGAWRPCSEEARRRADGALRLPAGAGERRRAGGTRGARHPARARRSQRPEREQGARPSSPRASASNSGRSWSTRPARCSARRPTSRRASKALAEPGAVLVTADVQRQVAGLFVAEDRGAHALKGVPAPVSALPHCAREQREARRGARTLDPARRSRGGARPLGRRWERAREGRGPARARSSASPASASRGSSRSSARGSARPRTPWSSGRRRSSCRIRLCTRSPNGAASASAARRPRADKRLADLESTLRLIGLDPAEYAPLSRRWSTSPARGPHGETRARGIAAPAAGGAGAWILAGARSQPSRSPSRTCTGPTRPRSTSWRRSPSGARRRRSSSSQRRGRSSARPGACARTTA